jgi:ABC-type branched-subunit amino acid transport system substrate-binding protein
MIGKDLIEAGTRKLLVIDDTGNPVFCKSFISGIEKALQDTDGKDTVRLSFDSSNQPSFRELASRGLALEAEAVVFCSSSIDTAVLSQHLKLGDPGLDLYSAEWAVSANLLENGGEFVEGLSFYSVMNHSDDSETFNVFRDRYRQRFGIVPNLAAMNYYETVNVLSEALSQDCSVTEPSALLETIVTTGMFQGVQRGFHFDKEGDAVVPLMKHLIKEGKFVRIDQE